MTIVVLLALFVLATGLLFHGRAFWAWVGPLGLLLLWWWLHGTLSGLTVGILAVPYGLAVVSFGVPLARRPLVARHVMRAMAPIFPSMSETERVALEAGTVWWDAELFTGAPDWRKLVQHRAPGLTEREKAFLENEVEEVCRMVDNEEIDRVGDLDEATWGFLKTKGFFGMIIPEEFGGLGFSAEANSAIVAKVSSRSVTLAVTVMVPNSLGPAELLLHYGTSEQKQLYLPRLARGDEIPAFALTEPHAGSDASSMRSSGVVCRGRWEGEEVLGIRLHWDKRYITLAPVATLLGLAFKLRDPDRLLGDVEDLGITCALIPVGAPGVEVGRRHDPLGIKFLNGPTTGKDVFVPVGAIIGGAKMAGQGWRMLMDCLSAGRSISLPAQACGGAQLATRLVSAYAIVREQFGLPLGRFEGIEEPLGRMAGRTWLMDAARRMTAGAVAGGEKPSVVSAIVKSYLTEGMREVINHAMDIQGGAGISRGPRNTLARMYQGAPIGITVEGANILTRTLIIYGQGALRCHPYAFAEMEAARNRDLAAFDESFFRHVGFVFSNLCRSAVMAWTGGTFVSVPEEGLGGDYMKRFSRMAAAFAIVSDVAMGTLGGALKRKELITGRLADCLAYMYLGSAAIVRFLRDGRKEDDEAFLRWSCDLALHEAQEALAGVMHNLPHRWAARALRAIVFPLGRPFPPPRDRTTLELARLVMEDGDVRDRLTADVFLPEGEEHGLARLDAGRSALLAAAEARSKLKKAVRAGELPRREESELLELAVEKDVLTKSEREAVRRALELQEELVQVDAFGPEEYLARCGA